MPTDNDRREVARRLREFADDYGSDGVRAMNRADANYRLFNEIGFDYLDRENWVYLGDESPDLTPAYARHLADLIEPSRGSAGKAILCSHCENASWCGCEPGDEEGGCDFEPSVTEGEPPYNLYSLYEAVLKRHPRDEYAIEDDEVDELVDALLDICNVPGHERIQRSEPAYPDATASYKGWMVEVYDPDGVLVSPSNVAADLARAHADGKAPSEPKVRCVAEVKVDGERIEKLSHDAAVKLTGIDRDELLALADEIEDNDVTYCVSSQYVLDSYADRIRKALGVNQ